MEQKQFDKTIKESLEHLEVSFDATPWEGLERALDAMETSVPLAENDFDAFISNKLENLSIPAKQPNWERMSAALDEAGMSTAFDKEVKSKINTINPIYQPSHWELLAAQLRREKAVKESLYKNKLAEFTLLLLLLLNFYQYFPNYPTPTAAPLVATESATTEKKAVLDKVLSQNQALSSQEPTTLSVEKSTQENSNQVAIATKKVDKVVAKDKLANKSSLIADNTLYVIPNLPTIDIKGISSRASRQQIAFGIDDKTGLTIPVPEMAQYLDRIGLSNDLFVKTLPSLVPPSLATAKIIPLDCEQCKRPKIPALFRFGMVGHVGLSSAIHSSSQDLDFITKKLNHTGSTYGSGFTLGFKYNRYEVETGLIYVENRYEHFALHYKYPHQLKGLSLQTLQIPVTLRYNYAVLNDGKLHLYAQNGVAMNITLREQQDIFKLSRADANWLEELDALANNPSTRAILNKSNEGILGGDPLKDNRFFTVNLGLGAEYYLSPQWSIFLQPDFQYYISHSRIGPTKDRINGLQISFGVRSSFY